MNYPYNRPLAKVLSRSLYSNIFEDYRLFGLCYAMDGDYKGWNPYIERHLAIFVNCFLSRARIQLLGIGFEFSVLCLLTTAEV